uniref:C-type lectin domain-containing protein n=1 Tax=Equus caballus TaxID=9796 RepID=A0A3Q2L5R4_HORSE
MKLSLFLAVVFRAVSALHLGKTETSNFESPLGDEILPYDGEMPEHGTMEAPMEGLTLLEEEEEGGSGGEDAPEEEGAVKSVSALEEVDKDFQCPKEEDTVKQVGIPGCKTCCFVGRGTPLFLFYPALQCTWQRCYRGKLVSIHNLIFPYHIQCSARSVSQGLVRGGSCWHFYWGDGSAWKIWYWALSQPLASGGSCVSMWNRGGWRLPHCKAFLLCVCSYLAGPSPEFRAAPSLGPASPPMPAAPSSTTQE